MSEPHDAVDYRCSWHLDPANPPLIEDLAMRCDVLLLDQTQEGLLDYITVTLRNGQKIIVRPKHTTASDAPTQ